MGPYRGIVILLAVFPAVFAAAAGSAQNGSEKTGMIRVGNFSGADPGEAIPAGWEPLTFEDIESHTDYRLVDFNGTRVIRAKSDASASGLIRKVRIDPRKYPVIEWRWRATGIFEKGDVTRKSGDDYPARIYVAFEYDPDKVRFFERAKFEMVKIIYGEYPPIGAINYIWASNAPEGKIVPNAFTDRAMMIVVESGRENTSTWVTETRNILADYEAAFGGQAPMIRAIAIMTDSDNTGESTITDYGDIVMKASESE